MIFHAPKNILAYNQLGIGRLFYQLPLQLCRTYIDDILCGGSLDQLDSELLNTTKQFFDCNLNISESSRHLYIHRNTMVFRLDKLQKIIGLDLRSFDDAIAFKIALMIQKHINYVEKMNQ